MEFVEGTVALDSLIMVHQNQLILGWLLSSISMIVLLQVTTFETFYEVWAIIVDLYASRSRSRVMSLPQNLQQNHMEGRSMVEYLSNFKKITNALALSGDKVPDSNLDLYALWGLGATF